MSLRLIDYTGLARDAVDNLRAEIEATRFSRARVERRVDAFIKNANSEELAGNTVLRKLHESLDSCGLTRTPTQCLFHKKFIEGALPWIFGKNDFKKYRDVILEEAGCPAEKYNQYTLISTPRRWGKTTSVSLFVACMLFCVPNIWISVYSTGRRASKSLADNVHKFIKKLEEVNGTGNRRVYIVLL